MAGGAARPLRIGIIQNRDLFGDLADNERFVETYTRVLSLLHEVGSSKTLKELE